MTRSEQDDSVPPATNASTEPIQSDIELTSYGWQNMQRHTPLEEQDGYVRTADGSGSMFPTSSPSVVPSSTSNVRWQKPRNARQVAAQATKLATMVLNDEIDLETAKAYSAIIRTAAQMLSSEVQRARFLQREPDLSLDDD